MVVKLTKLTKGVTDLSSFTDSLRDTPFESLWYMVCNTRHLQWMLATDQEDPGIF